MKKLILIAIAVISINANAQKTKIKKQDLENKTVTDSVRWRKEHYVINRDSAYANPLIGIQKLMGGNKRFIEGKSIKPRQRLDIVKKLENGQQPFATIVGCSDSRVPSELIFDQGFGDLFIIRTAGQVSAAASYGSMEFSVLKLKTKLIVVLGHTECGAVAAAVSRPEDVPGHIVSLINEIKPAVKKIEGMPGNKVNNAVRQNVIEQVNSLRDLDPILHKNYIAGNILIVGAVYDIHTGKVDFIEETLKDLPKKQKTNSAATQTTEVKH